MTTRLLPTTAAVALAALASALTCWPAPASGAAGRLAVRSIPNALTAPASQQTDPVVHPQRGHPRTKFVLELTARQRLGANSGLRADYRVTVTRRGGGCAQAFTIDSATAGARLHERLLAPGSSGWCRGHYSGLVILERAPSCAPPAPNGPPVACPDFLLAPVTVGKFAFTVV
jgi:hypothetical protein